MPSVRPDLRKRIVVSLLAAIVALVVFTGLSTASDPTTPDLVAEPLGCDHEAPVAITDLGDPGPALIPLLEECPGLRPGARLVQPGCTMNFLFTDGTDFYMGTAGHCTSGVGQRKSAAGIGEFGTVAFRLFLDVGHDFALIKVDADKHDLLDPTLCTWNGPQDAEPVSHPGQPVHMYGWGAATDDEPYTRARSGVLLSASSTTINFAGIASGGDSGSPSVNALGSALGINTHVLLTGQGSPVVYGTHIGHALDLARDAGLDVEVVQGDSLP